MHIKKIVIKGFKSYAAEVTVDNLSEGHTAVLGWNGAGKSNFFQAIQFVLCDTRFEKLRKPDRVKLLHEGMGKREQRAYVEITFDNADHRLPYATDVVTLRRQIGMDKDVFFVNTKHTSKNDVHAMLESAGFSRSNPYYILEQGKVKNLALMTDAKRLDLFKEVAGTNVYEEKRANAQTKLVEAQSAQLLITEEYASLTKKLEHLEEEKSELQEYQQLDRRRRAFEHMLYTKECQHALNKLERIDMDRSSESENSELLHQMVTKTATKKRELEASIAQQESRLVESKARQAQLEAKRKGMLKTVAEKQQDYDEVSRHLSAARRHQTELEEELAVLEVDIQKCKDALGTEGDATTSSSSSLSAAPSSGAIAIFESKLQTFEELRGRYAECMQVVTSLQDIQGRSSQFRTQRDRDTYLASQIKELNESIATVETEAIDLGNDVNRLENIQLAQVEKELADEMKLAEECATRINAAGETIQKLKEERNAGSAARKQIWNAEEQLDKDRKNAFDVYTNANRALKATMNPSLASGLDAIKRFMKTQAGIRGPVIELFTITNDAYATAMEVVGKSSLFHVVVETDAIAAKCIDMLKKEKAGRVTFIPLNRVAEEIRHWRAIMEKGVREGGNEAQPLMNFIQVADPVNMPAIEQIFGRSILCRNIKIASQMAERHKMHAVTLLGDEVSVRGVLSGGYRGRMGGGGISRIESSRKIAESRRQMMEIDAEKESMAERVATIHKAVNTAMANMGTTENQRQRDRQTYARHMSAIQAIQASRREFREQLVRKQEAIAALSLQSERLTNARVSLETEMSTPLLKTLSPKQQEQLRTQRELSIKLQQDFKVAEKSLEIARARKTELETKLNSNLERRRAEIKHELAAGLHKQGRGIGNEQPGSASSFSSSSSSSSTKFANKSVPELNDLVDSAEDALSTAKGELEETESQLLILRKASGELSEEIGVQRSELEESTVLLTEQLQGLDDHSAALATLLGKRNLNIQRRDQATRKIRELGAVHNAVKEFANEGLATMKKKELIKQIKDTVSQLKQYNKVNTKALNQYINFAAQRNTLKDRKIQCAKDEQSINRLIEHLDQQKDEKLMTTFRQVQKQFTAVFGELVDGGVGKLVLQRGASVTGDDSGKSSSEEDDMLLDEEDEEESDKASDGESSSEESSSEESSSEDDEESSSSDDENDRRTSSAKRESKAAKKARRAERSAAKEARRLAKAQKLRKSVASFTGVGVKVKFSGDADTMMTKRLSGGQKDIVALALILAIQRTDPAPFYIFDELDAALDDTRRSAVANLINRQAHVLQNRGRNSRNQQQGAQFITSTFRSELVDVADSHIQVYQNANTKASEVRAISLPDAQMFMQRIDARQNKGKKLSRRQSGQLRTGAAGVVSPAASSMASMSLASSSSSSSAGSGDKRKRSP